VATPGLRGFRIEGAQQIECAIVQCSRDTAPLVVLQIGMQDEGSNAELAGGAAS
jgi:hypothetical protein